MLSDRDALLLKLALERRLIDAETYGGILEDVPLGAGVPKLLRARGVEGKAVGLLVELATPAAGDPRAILSRADAEQVLLIESLRQARLVPEPVLARAAARVREEAAQGRFLAPTEVLVELGALEVPQAAALRGKARGLLATCEGCWRHYLVRGRAQGRCSACDRTIEAGVGLSAVDAWRGFGEPLPLNPGEVTRKFDLTLPMPPRPAVVQAQDPSDTAPPAPEEEEEEHEPDPAARTTFDPEVEEPDAADEPAAARQDAASAAIDSLLADWDASIAAGADMASSERTSYFGGYEVLGEIARGGMGVVYRARRLGQEGAEEVALKVLLGGAQASARQGARFEREAELARRLHHPGIVRFIEAGINEGFRFLAVELVPGKDLEETVAKRGPLPWADAARVIAEVADAVHYVHGEGVIHRDLKPDNVILRPDGRPVLIDFGLAKILEARQLTESTSTIGTPAYMPPEQVAGKSREAGPQADVYALGAILHFLIAGKPPFPDDDQVVLYRRIATDPPPPLRLSVPDVPAALEKEVLRALAKEPRERHATAEELGRALRAAIDPKRPPPPRRGAPRLLVALALTLLLVAAALAVLALRR